MNCNDIDPVRHVPRQPAAEQPIETNQKRRQRLSRTGWRCNERMFTGSNRRPTIRLRRRWFAEAILEPTLDQRMKMKSNHGNHRNDLTNEPVCNCLRSEWSELGGCVGQTRGASLRRANSSANLIANAELADDTVAALGIAKQASGIE